MFTSEIRLFRAPSRLRARTTLISGLLSSAALAVRHDACVVAIIDTRSRRGVAAKTANRDSSERRQQGAPKRAKRAARNAAAKPAPLPDSEPAPTPLNSNVVAGSASHLGLTAHETPATVEVVSQQTMREQGYRTTSETAIGAVGVLAGDAGGAFGSFSMRGFTGDR